MKAYGGVNVYIHIFLILAVVEGEWSASLPYRLTTERAALGTLSIGGCMGPSP
jgi:hypothetical protein